MNLSNTYKIGSLISLKKGKKPNNLSSENIQGLMPYVDIKSFETGVIDKYTDGEKCVECKDGDLLIVCDGSRSGLIGKAIEGFVGSTLALIELDGRIDKNYLYYFIQGKYQLLNKNVKGTGTPHLKQDLLKSFEIAIPSLEIQKQIVQQIEESLSQLDSAVETLKKTKQQLEVYRLSLLKDVFMTSGPMIPFKAITESRLGKMLDKEKNTGILREYLRNINVRWFDFDLSDLLEMRIEDKETEKCSIKKGDLVICEGGEPGRCAVWESDDTMYYQKALHRVRFTDGSNPKYYMYYLWFINRTGALSEYFTGTGIKHLTGQSLAKVPVPSVSVQQQNEAVSYIEDRFYSIDQVDKIINQSLQQSEALRQSILKQAFEVK